MIAQIFVLCLVPTLLLAAPATVTFADVVRPRSLSPEAFEAQVRDFWTPERLREAKPLDIIQPAQTGRSVSNNTVVSGPVSQTPGSLPTIGNSIGKAIASNGRQVLTTGRVFWQVGTSSYSCSASIVTSTTGDLVATAAHCVYDAAKRMWYNNNRWVFAPAYSNGVSPYGQWAMRRMIALTGYTNGGDYNYDVAFVAVSPLNGQRLQQRFGSQGIGFNLARPASVYSFGYPGNINNGLTLQQCSGVTTKSLYTQNSYRGHALSCGMGQGCSGGPWLQNVVDSTGVGYITSVNSFMIVGQANVLNGPYFDSNIKVLYDAATNM